MGAKALPQSVQSAAKQAILRKPVGTTSSLATGRKVNRKEENPAVKEEEKGLKAKQFSVSGVVNTVIRPRLVPNQRRLTGEIKKVKAKGAMSMKPTGVKRAGNHRLQHSHWESMN